MTTFQGFRCAINHQPATANHSRRRQHLAQSTPYLPSPSAIPSSSPSKRPRLVRAQQLGSRVEIETSRFPGSGEARSRPDRPADHLWTGGQDSHQTRQVGAILPSLVDGGTAGRQDGVTRLGAPISMACVDCEMAVTGLMRADDDGPWIGFHRFWLDPGAWRATLGFPTETSVYSFKEGGPFPHHIGGDRRA